MKQQLITKIINAKIAKGITEPKCCRGMHG